MPEDTLPPQVEPEEAPETPRPEDEKTQAELSDLRASMAEEEARQKVKKKTGVLKKITGMLHLQTGYLAGSQPADAPAPAQDDEITDVILAEQVGKTFQGWDEAEWQEQPEGQAESALESDAENGDTPEPVQPDPLETKPLIWDENDETFFTGQASPAGEDSLRTNEPMPAAAPAVFTDDEIADEPSIAAPEGEGEPPAPAAEAESEPSASAPETAQTESLRAELMPEASPAVPSREKPNPGLWKRVTGWLNPAAIEKEEEAPAEVADELISDRLQRAQSGDYPPVIPGQKKFEDLPSSPAFVAKEGEAVSDGGGLQGDSAQTEEDVWSRSSTATPQNPSVWKRESLLPVDWVDSQAAFAQEERVATDYLDHSKTDSAQEQPAVKTPSLLSEMNAQGAEEPAPAIEDVRSLALEDYVEPEVDAAALAPQAREPFWQRARTWVRLHFALTIALAAGLVVLVALAAIQPWNQAPIAQPNTPVPSDQPYPVGLEMTGGWFFDIQRSTIVNGVWQPQGAEWLDNSQLRRVVALPWNKQSDAVIQTLQRGDQINLVFSNNDLIPFLVKSVERLDQTDTELFSENKPGLVIFLYGEESGQRWVVLALPK